MTDQTDLPAESVPEAPPEERESLWLITFGPSIWAIHFVLSYVTAAIWCAKVAGRSGMLGDARLIVAGYTVVALIGITLTGLRGWKLHSFGTATAPHDFDTPEDRHRFLGFATLLLCGLSFVATIFVTLCVVFIRSCE